MVLLIFAIVSSLLVLVQPTLQETHRKKYVSNTTTNFAESLRLRDMIADERYAPMLKDLKSPIRRTHNRQSRAAAHEPYGYDSLDIDLTTPFSVSARKNTKRTKTDKKTTKFSAATVPTSTPAFTPSKSSSSTSSNGKVKPTVSPTKYHYYPHNQHMYLLPECAIQQVCNAVYVRLNYTQPLCACPPRYRDPCSASLNEDDNHTLKLIGNEEKKAITLAKTCETTNELRDCRPPRDWSILALQNTRTGKSHYLVICKCPPNYRLEGPLAHDQPTYAGLPGINVYGMLCVPPHKSASQSFVSKWKETQRFPISSYRSKNSTITAEPADTTETDEDETNSIESETARDIGAETTVTENYAVQEEEQTERDTTEDDNSSSNSESATTEAFTYTTDPVTEEANLTE